MQIVILFIMETLQRLGTQEYNLQLNTINEEERDAQLYSRNKKICGTLGVFVLTIIVTMITYHFI